MRGKSITPSDKLLSRLGDIIFFDKVGKFGKRACKILDFSVKLIYCKHNPGQTGAPERSVKARQKNPVWIKYKKKGYM